ncbi:MAG: RHS repeat-associated core domain-containing protein, partial [Saprospiraceae bacterium]
MQSSPVARERIYLGGAEFVNDTLELYHHAEGRVVWRDTTPAFQYRIADHLGNTVVFFEDRDGDTKIKTEPMTSDPDSLEVLQRNYYYPFGMEMEGPWQAVTAPRADYLYNGKELEEDLGLNWYAYGFRYYDPSIGRFTGVDPLAVEYAAWSPY